MEAQKIFDIVESEADDFQTLLSRSGLDPHLDLRNADFSHVDFGIYCGDILNLSGCNLQYADLTRVKAKLILKGADLLGTKLPAKIKPLVSEYQRATRNKKLNILNTALLSIYRFEVSTTIPNRISEDIFGRTFLSGAFTMIGGQDYLTNEVANAVIDKCVDATLAYQSSFSVKVLISRNFPIGQTKLPADATDHFLKSLQNIDQYHLSNITPKDGEAIERTETVFGKTVAFDNLFFLPQTSRRIIIFSGFPPISKKIVNDIRKITDEKVMMIFLLHSKDFELYRHAKASGIADLKFIQRDWRLKSTDIETFKGRLRRISEIGLPVSRKTYDSVDTYLGKPQSELKNAFLRRIYSLAKQVTSDELPPL